jgi:hypothetical protein
MASQSRAMTPTVAEKALTRHAPQAAAVIDGFNRTSKRFKHSRARIRRAEMVRRDMEQVYADQAWVDNYGEDPADWVQPSLPERKTLTRNLTNALSEAEPFIERRALGDTDTDKDDANLLEQWSNASMTVLYDHEEVIGKGVEDGEFPTLVLPEPASLLGCPQYMEPDGKGGRRVKAKYGPDLSGRKKHRQEMLRYFADHPPIVVRHPSALDCAPVLVHGRRGTRFECTGLFVRTLYDVGELEKRYEWSKLVGDRELIPRAFDSGSMYGRDGQVYLYEAFMLGDPEIDDDGIPHARPFIVYCVGGMPTRRRDDVATDQDSVVVIDLWEEYGIDYPLWDYDWALHTNDDDPDFRGLPFLDPLIPTLLNLELLLLADHAQTYENAFSGHVTELPPGENAETWMNGGKFVQIHKPQTGEVSIVPGPVKPFVGAPTGDGAKRLEEFHLGALRTNTPDEAQFGGSGDAGSGRQLVVERGLFHTAHRQVPAFGLRKARFVATTILKLACGLARGEWKGMKAGVNLAFEINVEAIPGGSDREGTDLVELNDRWVGDNYDLKAVYPSRGNLAEVGQLSELYDKGQASWDRLMEAQGISNPDAERVKTALDDWWKSDEGKAELREYALKRSGRTEQAAKLKAIRDQQMTPGGMPTSALAPEAMAPPQMMTAPTGTPGAEAMGQEVSAQMGTNTLVQDAQMASQINQPGAATMAGGALPAGAVGGV